MKLFMSGSQTEAYKALGEVHQWTESSAVEQFSLGLVRKSQYVEKSEALLMCFILHKTQPRCLASLHSVH